LSFASPRRGGLLVLLATTAALAGAAPAMADITTATITTPSESTFLQYDTNTGDPQPVDIEGTSDGTRGDHVNVRCYDASFGDFIDLTDVAVEADGSFSVPDADLSPCSQTLFRLRAVPADTDDFDWSTFAGPLFGNGYRNISYDLDQPVGRQLYDYELRSVTADASNDYSSVSSAGLAVGDLFDSDTTPHGGSWEGVDTLQNGGRDGEPGRSEITIDGHDVYTPRGAHDINSGAAGLPPEMTVTSDAPDAATGELTIQETDPLVYCGDGSGDIADPDSDTAAACPEFLPAPVQLVRTITESHGGLQSTIVDRFSATDAAPHALTLAYDNRLTHAAGNIRFPGESAYSAHADGVTPSLGPDGQGAIFVEQNHGAPGPDNVQGAIAYATRPDRALVQVKAVDNSDQTTLQLQYTRTIPATGSAEVSQSYIQGFDRDDVATGAGVPTDAAQGPSVAFTSPVDSAGVTNDAVTVTGTAFDNGGLLSLAVGGRPTSVSPDGTWSQTITGLAAGTNTITVVAHDHAGNTAQASLTVVYTPPETPPAQDDDETPPPAAPVVAPPVAPVASVTPSCTVPKVAGLPSAGAAAAIVAAGCSVGNITSTLSAGAAKGAVVRQSRAVGARVPVYFPVDLVLSSGKAGQAKAVSSATLKDSKLTIRLTCPQADGNRCTGSITITSKTTVGGHKLALGTHKFTVRAGRSGNVVFTVKSTVAQAIRHAHTVKATVSLKGASSGAASSLTIKG
jgi:hypothetical protein